MLAPVVFRPNSTSNSNLSSEDTTFSNSKNHKLQHSYDEIYEFYDGLARVQRNGMYGFINESGEEVIPCKYEYLSIFFSNEYCEVTKDDLSGLIDKTGQIIVPCKYDAVDYDEDIDLSELYIPGRTLEVYNNIDSSENGRETALDGNILSGETFEANEVKVYFVK